MNFNLLGFNIKNFCNLEMKQCEKKEEKTFKLGYDIKSFSCFPEKIQYVTAEGDYKTKEIKEFLDRLKENSEKFSKLKKLIIYQIEIKNIGNEIISASDFFENAKLRVNCCDLYLGFVDSYLTPQYINAHIEKWDNYEFYIDFDCIKPNDSMYISFISDKAYINYFIKVLGKTKTFKCPIPISYKSLKDNTKEKKNFKVFILQIIVGIIILGCLISSLYMLDHPNLKFQIRLIDGVENNAK